MTMMRRTMMRRTMMRRCCGLVATVALAVPLPAVSAEMQEGRFDLGVRLDALTANGEPADFMPGLGVYTRFRLSEQWRVGFGIGRSEFDFECPAAIARIPVDCGARSDAKSSMNAFSLWLERAYRSGGGRELFWSVGFGGAAFDVAQVNGSRRDGGSYAVATNFDGELGVEEVIVSAAGGWRWPVNERSAIDLALRVDLHIADWEVVDQLSQASGRLDDFAVWGLSVGWAFRL